MPDPPSPRHCAGGGRAAGHHSFMIPGFLGVGVSTVVAYFLSRIAF